MIKKKNKQLKPEKTSKPSKRDMFYYNWAIEMPKENIQIANDYLNKMLNFSVALFSIVAAFNDKIGKDFSSCILGILIFSTCICFIGNYPMEESYNPYITETIEESTEKIITKKKYFLLASFVSIFLSMCVIVVSIFYNN